MTDLLKRYQYAATQVKYDPETGEFIWLKKKGGDRGAKVFNTRFAGKNCGTVSQTGYIKIMFAHDCMGQFIVRAHRLAWYISTGKMPVNDIDHINQNKKDNRISNLRDVTRSTNHKNRKRSIRNTSGITGVSWNKKSKKWIARSAVMGKQKYLGAYEDITKAEEVVKTFRSNHGYTAIHGSEG